MASPNQSTVQTSVYVRILSIGSDRHAKFLEKLLIYFKQTYANSNVCNIRNMCILSSDSEALWVRVDLTVDLSGELK